MKLLQEFGNIATWILFAFFNAVVTVLVLIWWAQRLDMIEPANNLWVYIDMWFPNEQMELILTLPAICWQGLITTKLLTY